MTVLEGDCRTVMATLEAESISAIVTDPPYDLTAGRKGGSGPASENPANPAGRARIGNGRSGPAGGFMGKGWDATGVAFDVETWRQAYRVAKPGAYLLAAGGTRTYHRMVSAIEDAGWEIRDTLCWIYSSGFPKSLDVAKQPGTCHCRSNGSAPEAEHDVRPLPNDDVPETERAEGGRRQVLLAAMQEPGPRVRRRNGTAGTEAQAPIWGKEPSVERRSDAEAPEGELPRRASRESPGLGEANGPEGRLHPGAPAGHGDVDRQAPESIGDGEPHQSRPVGQSAGEPRPLADERGAQAGRGWPRCDRCGKPQVDGLGTALKPAWEPWVLARKPLIGTVAANVIAHGTGALNIDATRIPVDPNDPVKDAVWTSRPSAFREGTVGFVTSNEDGQRVSAAATAEKGRWPSNVILTDPVFDIEGAPYGFGDEGTYSRFFLIPKASRSDREPVLGGLSEQRVSSKPDGRQWDIPGSLSRDRMNNHPTVKPTELMRHLIRLVTPPGGVILDPFLGSGTTAIAAEIEGFAWIGIELDPESVAIINARLPGTQRGLGLG